MSLVVHVELFHLIDKGRKINREEIIIRRDNMSHKDSDNASMNINNRVLAQSLLNIFDCANNNIQPMAIENLTI